MQKKRNAGSFFGFELDNCQFAAHDPCRKYLLYVNLLFSQNRESLSKIILPCMYIFITKKYNFCSSSSWYKIISQQKRITIGCKNLSKIIRLVFHSFSLSIAIIKHIKVIWLPALLSPKELEKRGYITLTFKNS